MSGNPTRKMIPVLMEMPEDFGVETGETVAELKLLVAELRELMKNAFAPISLTEKELAEYFGISLISMERIRRAGKIRYKRVAGKIHYTRRHIEDFLNSGSK